jgi:hypothetical protein
VTAAPTAPNTAARSRPNSRWQYRAQQRTFDLTVDGIHTYYVVAGDTPVLVHNCGDGFDDLRRTVASFEYTTPGGRSRTIVLDNIPRNTPGVPAGLHAEIRINRILADRGVDPLSVTLVYANRSFCPICSRSLGRVRQCNIRQWMIASTFAENEWKMEELENIDESSVDRSMTRWYGVTRPRADVDDQRIPLPLARWFELTAAGGERVTQYYQVRSPDALPVVDGLLVFCDDPAGEFVWACAQQDADPPTFERINDEPRWLDTGFLLSSLILYIAVAGAVLSARTGLVNTNISREDYDRAIGSFRKLQNPLWAWPDPKLSYYVGDRMLAFGGHGGDPVGWQLLIGATDEQILNRFDDIEWEWDSRTGR